MKLIYSTKLASLDKEFREIGNGIENIAKDDDILKNIGLELAKDFLETINEKYVENLRKISDFEHGPTDIRTYITNTKAGYIVHVSGKNTLYEEYGTGSRGFQKPHPLHGKKGMNPYGSGRNIIHNGMRNDGREPPYWYKLYRDFPGGTDYKPLPNDLNNAQIRVTDYVWRHNGIITKGLPAGRFIYDSCQKYKRTGGLGDNQTLKRTINQVIKKDFVGEINKEVKKKSTYKQQGKSIEQIKAEIGL